MNLPTDLRKNTPLLRTWHWINVSLIALSLLSVFIAKNILSPRKNAGKVQELLKSQGFTADEHQSKEIAHFFNDKIWEWHQYIGYCIAAAVLLRIIAELLSPSPSKFKTKWQNALLEKGIAKRVPLVYSFFYLTIVLMAATGLFMSYSDDMESLKDLRHQVKEIHSVGMYLLIAFILIHLAGLLRAEILNAKSRQKQ